MTTTPLTATTGLDDNAAIADAFYTAFAAKDGARMASFYAAEATFEDPVFPSLKGREPGAMWRMLTRSKDLVVRHEILSVDGDRVTARWVANYTFPATGRAVENHVTSTLELRDGQIVRHVDVFDLSAWLGQAFGVAGRLPGAKVLLAAITRRSARRSLDAFLARHG